MDQTNSNAAYFERRASEETQAAGRASDERARLLHLELAQRYSIAARSGGAPGIADEAGQAPIAPAPLLQPEFRILP